MDGDGEILEQKKTTPFGVVFRLVGELTFK